MIKNINNELNKIQKKYKEVGLDNKDYKYIMFLAQQAENQKKIKAYKELKNIINELRHSDVVYSHARENYLYVKNKLPLLPLVLASGEPDKVRFYKENGVKLYYYYENDITRSYGVHHNHICYYKDPIETFNSIEYMMIQEGLSLDDTIKLMCAVYNCDYPNNNIDRRLVNYYKDGVVSDYYRYLLDTILKRAQENGRTDEKMLIHHENALKMIDIVKNDKPNPDFIYREKQNVLIKK